MSNKKDKIFKLSLAFLMGLVLSLSVALVISVKKPKNEESSIEDDVKQENVENHDENESNLENETKENSTGDEYVDEEDSDESEDSKGEVTVDIEQNQLETEILNLMNSGNDNLGVFELNRVTKTFTMSSDDSEFATEILRVSSGEVEKDVWDSLAETVRGFSLTISDNLGEEYSVEIQNPMNEDRILLKAQNGEILYDFMNGEPL